MKKKHLTYAKKTLSVMMAVLMLMSCWVFFPGMVTFEAGAAATDTTYRVSADKYGTPYWTPTDSNTHWVLWGVSRDASKAHFYMQMPKTIYLDKDETLQSAGYKLAIEWSYGNSTSFRIAIAPAVWGYGAGSASGSESAEFLTMTNLFNGYDSNVSLHKGAVNEYGVNGYTNANQADLRQDDGFDGNKGVITLKNMGDTSNKYNNIYLIGAPKGVGSGRYSTAGINPDFVLTQKWGSNWARNNDAIDMENNKPTTASEPLNSSNEVWWNVVIYDKSELNSAITNANTYLSQASKYTVDSVNNLRTAVNNATTVLKKREVTQGEINTQRDNVNNAVNSLVEATNFDITFENMFSLTDWMNSESFNKQSNTSVEIIVENDDTIKIYKYAVGGEVFTAYSSGTHAAAKYSMPVTGGKRYTVRYDIADNSSVSGTAQSQVYIFWYDANNNPVTNTAGTYPHDSKTFYSKGACSATFTAPENAAKAEIRFDNDCPSGGTMLRFKDIAVYPADRAEEVELESWTTRPYRKVYSYHAPVGSTLPVPARNGYDFNGWYLDNSKNGKMDDGEAVTDGKGNVIIDTTFAIDKHYNLYADWTPQTLDIGYDNMFSLADWAKTNSVNPGKAQNGTITYDVMAGTITAESTANGEVYSNYGSGSDQYVMAVEPNSEYIFEADMELATGSKGQIFVFFYDANGTAATGAIYNGAAQDNAHIGIYPTTEGTSSIAFTTPSNCTKMAIRVGATDVGTKAVFSNIGLYEKEIYDAYAKDYAVVRVPFKVGDTKKLELVPTRAGYRFDGWFAKDGKQLSSVEGLKESDTVYAKWTELFTVTFKNWNNEVLKEVEVAPGEAATAPQAPTRTADANYEYDFKGWNKDFTNVQSDLVVIAEFQHKDHTGISKTYASPATCTSAAKYTQLCTACNYVWDEVFDDTNMPALGHTYERENPSSTVVTGTSTGKTDDDVHTIKCNACDETTTVKHNFIEDSNHPATEATCVIAGKVYYKCACLEEKTVEGSTNPNKHVNTVLKDVVAAECEKPGYSGDTYCNDCKKTVATGSETEALEHKYTSYEYNEGSATCFANGTETATCDLCKVKTDTREAADTKLEHVYTKYVYNEGTAKCEVNGTETATCDHGCKTTDTREAANTALEHDYTGDAKDNGDGTHSFLCKNECGKYGAPVACSSWKENETEGKCECTVCGYTKAHTWTAWATVGGSATSEATQTRSCKVCGKVESTECKYEITTHKDATCEAAEITTYKCADCNHGYTVIGEGPKGHNFTADAGVKSHGNGTHSFYCANNCGEYGFGTTKNTSVACSDWEYANTEAGKHTATCKVCAYDKSENCSGGTATCTDKAKCQFCNTAYGELADHNYTGTEKYLFKATEATCTKNETYYYYCIGCEKTVDGIDTYEKPDTMKPHTYTGDTWYDGAELAEEAKCGVNETYYVYCADCNASSKDTDEEATFEKADTALAHNYDGTIVTGNDDGTHTITCANSNLDNWACDSTITANCADSALSTGGEEATCISQGYTTYQCSLCGYDWNDNYTDALGHDYTQKIYNQDHLKEAANCEHANIYWYDCSRCDKNGKDETDTEKYTTLTFFNGEVRKHDFQNKVDAEYLADEATCLAAAKYYTSCKYEDCGKSSEEVNGEGKGVKFSSGSALGHDWKEPADDVLGQYEATPADCVNDATYYYVCSRAAVCGVHSSKGVKEDGETWTDVGSKSGHDFDHEDGHKKANAATCDAAGNYEYWHCEKCGKYFKDAEGKDAYLGQSATVIKKRDHDLESFAFKAATCEEDGHPAYVDCKYEDCTYTTLPEKLDEGYKAKGHNFTGAWTFDSVNLYHSKLCLNDCGKSGMVVEGKQVEFKVEFNEDDEAVITGGEKCDFTYKAETKNGIHTHVNTCECGNGTTKTYSDEETFVETVAPTCTADGYDSYKCEACEDTWKKNIVKTEGHKPGTAATPNNDGTHSYICTVEGCGYKVSTEKCSGGTATCKDQAVCEKCNASYGKTGTHVYAEGSEWVYQNDATCTDYGTEKNTCTACNTEVSRKAECEDGKPLGHKMTEYGYDISKWTNKPEDFDASIIIEPTCKDEGVAISYCTRCDVYKTKNEKADSSKHLWNKDTNGELIWNNKGGNCATGVTLSNVCTVCGAEQTKTTTVDHDWEDVVTVKASCKEANHALQRCKVCLFERDYEYAPALGHTWEREGAQQEIIPDKQATCGQDGRGHYECADCNEVSESVVIPRKNHVWDLDGDSFTDEGFTPAEGYTRDYVYIAAEKATCKNFGHDGYYKCSYCSYDQHLDQVWIDVYSVKYPVMPHYDNNEDGKCDECKLKLFDGGIQQPDEEDGKCNCICHKEGGFMRFIYKIIRFFWKLFGIGKTCECSTVHY